MVYELLDRISYSSYLGSIKYVGPLPEWENVIALGVEWDVPQRGKNSGSINGIQYFTTKIEGAGSFIKSTNRKLDTRTDFTTALVDVYGESHDFTTSLHFGTKVVEGYGFDRLNAMQADFNQLQSISLQRKCIYKGNEVDLPKVNHLDLSYNLFSDIHAIWIIIERMTLLETLVLNGNRFFTLSPSLDSYLSVRVLQLSSTNFDIPSLRIVFAAFPNLEELYLAGNGYSDADIPQLCLPDSIKILDLSYNELESIPLWLASSKLLSLNLSHNKISNVPQFNSRLQSLDLRQNMLDSWNSIDQLYYNFPNLSQLRVNGNTLFENISIDEMTINLISRFECQGSKDKNKTESTLKILNGSVMSTEEIVNAELYFISKVLRNVYPIDRRKDRWKKLVKKHSIKEADTPILKHLNDVVDKKLILQIQTNGNKTERVFLKDNTILRLKGIVSKLLTNIPITDFKLYYYINEMESNPANQIKQYLEDNLALLDSYGFLSYQTIYVA